MRGIDLEQADHGLLDDLRIVATPAARGLSQLVLRTDIAGMPLEWIDYKEAARLYHQEQVAYTCGSLLYELYGGTNARTGRRTGLKPAGGIRTPEQALAWAKLMRGILGEAWMRPSLFRIGASALVASLEAARY